MHRLLAQSFQIGEFPINGPTQNGGAFSLSDAKIGDIVGASLSYVFAFAGIGLLLMIIASGFSLILAAGDAKKMEKGKATLTNAIIGFIIIFAAFWIVQAAGVIFGWQNSINAIFGQ